MNYKLLFKLYGCGKLLFSLALLCELKYRTEWLQSRKKQYETPIMLFCVDIIRVQSIDPPCTCMLKYNNCHAHHCIVMHLP